MKNDFFFLFNRGDTYYTVFRRSPIKEIRSSPYATGMYSFSLRQVLSSQIHQCLCFAKVFLSHRSQEGNEHGLGALQHSLWPNTHSIHLAIWMKAPLFYDFCGSLWIFIQLNNFFKLPAPGIEPLTPGLQVQSLPPTPRVLPFWTSTWAVWAK